MHPVAILGFAILLPFCFGADLIGEPANVDGVPHGGILTPYTLEKRQLQCVNPGWYICPGRDKCCSPGYNCCTSVCCPTSSNCWGSSRYCCPKTALVCGNGEACCQPGGACCKSSPTGCCASGAICCNSSITPCCPKNYTCCGDECCTPGYQCINGSCLRFITQSETLTSTSVSTRTSTSTSPRPTQSQFPVIVFFYVPGLTDALVENICKGMNARTHSNVDILTYAPSGKGARRTAAGCTTGRCDYRNTGLSCDEYPFASTLEGGSGASISCVPAYQNTDQGIYMSSWYKYVKLKPGDKFGVEVVGLDCTSVMNLKRATVTLSGYNGTVLAPYKFDPQGSSRVVVPLGDLGAGSYTANVQITTGSISSINVVDSEGELLASMEQGQQAGQAKQISFTVPEDKIGVGLGLFTNDKTTNVSWTAEGGPGFTNSDEGHLYPKYFPVMLICLLVLVQLV